MKVTKDLIATSLSQSQIDIIMNNLLVDLQDFSSMACLDGRGYGVHIAHEKCEAIDINSCMRSAIIEKLISSHETAERNLGYYVTERFVSKHIEIDKYIGRYRVDIGIESLNVIQESASVSGFGEQAINYYIATAVVQDEGTYTYIDVSRDIVSDPNRITMRDSDQAVVVMDMTKPNRITINGDNWRIILDKPYITGSAYVGNTIYIQDPYYMTLDITPPTLANSGELHPVYPNSSQIIPCAKEPETITGGDVRYWFHPWVLVDERFSNDSDINLENGEFYKLLQEIEFKEFYTTQTLASIVYLDTDNKYQTTTSEQLLIDVIDAPKGIISINVQNWLTEDMPDKYNQISHIVLYYKTNPNVHGFIGEEMSLSHAIANLVAAEIEPKQCQCEIDRGFISRAQESYGEVRYNPIDRSEKKNIRYGDKVGQKVYYDYIDRIKKKRKRVKV